MLYTFNPIAYVRSPYTQKFGIPRQPQLVPAARADVVLDKRFSKVSVRGLVDFELIWVQFVFHGILDEGWTEMVRPPRLGGKKKVGIFATRSPHRPNHLGLSVLRLEGIVYEKGHVILNCSGADLLDGTPVLDIKPYLPFIEAYPNVGSGFASEPPSLLDVKWRNEADKNYLTTEVLALIEQSLAQDPRPAYQKHHQDEYAVEMGGYDVHFRVIEQTVWIESYQLKN